MSTFCYYTHTIHSLITMHLMSTSCYYTHNRSVQEMPESQSCLLALVSQFLPQILTHLLLAGIRSQAKLQQCLFFFFLIFFKPQVALQLNVIHAWFIFWAWSYSFHSRLSVSFDVSDFKLSLESDKNYGLSRKMCKYTSILAFYVWWPIKTDSCVNYMPPSPNPIYRQRNLRFALWNAWSENFPVPMSNC